jgi:drug/metabolite transporter (DMT)-like permease
VLPPTKITGMHALSRQQTFTLIVLTLVWGANWPILKLGVTGFPPLTFRAMSMWIGLPVLFCVLLIKRVPFRIPRAHWPELLRLGIFNMFIWHTMVVLAVQSLSSGRTAILGYTMPVFSALIGAVWFSQHLAARAWGGVAAAALGVVFLLWHEFTQLSGRPDAVALMLVGAAAWALGTQMLRRSAMPVPTLAISFWMTVLTTLWISLLAVSFEQPRWVWPTPPVWGAVVYNAIGVFAFAQVAWLSLARDLPPIASTLSVMFIPVLGVFSGAWWLGEVLHWQDWAAVALVLLAIASVLWPSRRLAVPAT